MKKLTFWVGVFATGLISTLTTTACSSTPDDTGTKTTGGSGGSGAGAGGTGTGGGKATQLMPPATYTILSGDAALPGTAMPPAKYTAICSACHQPAGQGFANLAPEIRHTPAAYATWVVRNGRPNTSMIPYPPTSADPKVATLTDAELTEIVTWLEALPKPTTGQALYQDFCGNCHGPMNPTGGAVAVNVQGLLTAEYGMKVRTGEGMDPSMRQSFMPPETADKLTDAELGLIQTYLMAK